MRRPPSWQEQKRAVTNPWMTCRSRPVRYLPDGPGNQAQTRYPAHRSAKFLIQAVVYCPIWSTLVISRLPEYPAGPHLDTPGSHFNASCVDIHQHQVCTGFGKAIAMARPIPWAAPVTTATFPLKSNNAILMCLILHTTPTCTPSGSGERRLIRQGHFSGQSAVKIHYLPGHELGSIRKQIDCQASNIFRQPDTPPRHEVVAGLTIVTRVKGEVVGHLNRSGCNDIDADVQWAKFDCQLAAESINRPFGAGIHRMPRIANQTMHGGNVDDGPASPGFISLVLQFLAALKNMLDGLLGHKKLAIGCSGHK